MLRFKKQLNGNVLITDENDKPIANYATPVNIFKHQTQQNSLLITDDASCMESDKGLVVSFGSVDLANCQPIIVATDINELVEALAANFFFRKPVVETVYKGEFLENQDVTLYNGKDFDILYEGSTNQVKVNNKVTGWFDAFARTTKNTDMRDVASDIQFAAGEYYFSTNGNQSSQHALSNAYASYFEFRVCKESVTGKEVIFGELMRAGSIINANIFKL